MLTWIVNLLILIMGFTSPIAYAQDVVQPAAKVEQPGAVAVKTASIGIDCRQSEGKLNWNIALDLSALGLEFVALKVYAEPSHTLLTAGVNEAFPQMVEAVQNEKPNSLVRGSSNAIASMQGHLVGLPLLENDDHLIINSIAVKDGAEFTKELFKFWAPKLADFGYSVAFNADAQSYTISGWCGDEKQVIPPIKCDSFEVTICCPKNELHCGKIDCTL